MDTQSHVAGTQRARRQNFHLVLHISKRNAATRASVAEAAAARMLLPGHIAPHHETEDASAGYEGRGVAVAAAAAPQAELQRHAQHGIDGARSSHATTHHVQRLSGQKSLRA